MSRKKSIPNIEISNPTLINVLQHRAVYKADNPEELSLVPSNEPSVTLQLSVKVLQTDTTSTLKEVLEKGKVMETRPYHPANGPGHPANGPDHPANGPGHPANEPYHPANSTSECNTQLSSNSTSLAAGSAGSRRHSPSSKSNSPILIPHKSASQPGSPVAMRSHSPVGVRSHSPVLCVGPHSPATKRADSPATKRADSPATKRADSPATKRADSPTSQPYNPANQLRLNRSSAVLTHYQANEDEVDSRVMTLQRSHSAQNIHLIKEEEEAIEVTKTRAKKGKMKKVNGTKASPLTAAKHPATVDRLISAPVLVDKTSFTAELSPDGYALVPTTKQSYAKPLEKAVLSKMKRSQSLLGDLDLLNDEVCAIPLAGVSSTEQHKVAYDKSFSVQEAHKPHPHHVCPGAVCCDDDIKKVLFNPRSVEALLEALQLQSGLVNCYDSNMEAPIHAILKRKNKGRLNLLVTLLSNSPADVNLPAMSTGHTPLHIAVKEEDEMCVKALLAFGANIDAPDMCHHTLLKACTNGKLTALLEKAIQANIVVEKNTPYDMPDKVNETLMEYMRRKGERMLCDEMEESINRTLSISTSFSGSSIDPTAIALQQKEIGKFKKTGGVLPYEIKKDGVKILCLDGGGMKGLAQIEVLSQLEEATGRKITELFDWIVGTSTGAIIALGLVYAGMTLAELRRLYFTMKDKIFGKGRHNSEALELILKEAFGSAVMNDVKQPKVMIGAVNKETTNLELRFFNNCFDDVHSKQEVWKVARYTSAAPLFFTECENYVDGGVLANNPCEYALTAIQNYYREQKIRPLISLLVSVGSGVYPALKLGNIDAQQFLYFGIHTFRLDILKDRASNLISLLSNALVESEAVAKNCKSRCEEQGILFYRFSPKLDEVIAAGETDNERLVNMLVQTKLQLKEQGLQELANLILRHSNSSKDIN